MIVQVIPLRRMPFEMFWLDYSVPENLTHKILPGSLVTIPFRNQISYGIVAHLKQSDAVKKIKIKDINGLVFEAPLIPPNIVDFIEEFSLFYRVSPGIILKNLIFKLIKKNVKLAETLLISRKIEGEVKIGKKPILFNYKSSEEKFKKILELSLKKGQKLILTPTVEQANDIAGNLSDNIKKNCILITSETTDKQFFEHWLRIRNGENLTVIGTRRAIFLPWMSLTFAIMDDEGDSVHKSWDMAPRFHSRDALLLMSKYINCEIYLFSHTPSIESYFFAKKNIYTMKGEVQNFISPSPIFVKYNGNNKSALDDEIVEALSNTKKNCFIYINRKSAYSSAICKDCGYVFRCKNCGRALNLTQINGSLNCLFCDISEPFPFECPKCAGSNFVFLGQGAKSIVQDIKNKLPKKNVILIDKESLETKINLQGIDNSVIVGTEFAWMRVNWNNLDALVMVDPDFSLMLPEYRATEDLWQKIRQAQFLLPENSSFFIQTCNREHYVYLGVYKPDIFYGKESLERKKFNYPPFKYLVRLLIDSSNKEYNETLVNQFKNEILSLTQGKNSVIINGPLKTNPPYYRGKYWHVMLIKSDYSNYKKITKKIAKIIPSTWKFDPNPINIISIA